MNSMAIGEYITHIKRNIYQGCCYYHYYLKNKIKSIYVNLISRKNRANCYIFMYIFLYEKSLLVFRLLFFELSM